MLFDQCFYLIFRQVVFFTERFDLQAVRRNAESNEELFGDLHAALGECLVVFRGAAVIGVALKYEMSIGFEREIFLEVVGERRECLLLAFDQAYVWPSRRRQSRREVDAADG